MFVVYCWENPNSLQKLYIAKSGLVNDVRYALWWNSIEAINEHKEEIINFLRGYGTNEYFIGELEPTCRGFFGEF